MQVRVIIPLFFLSVLSYFEIVHEGDNYHCVEYYLDRKKRLSAEDNSAAFIKILKGNLTIYNRH